MKKILLSLFVAVATLVAASSCTKEYITEEHITNNYLPGISYVAKVVPGDWKYEGNGVYSVDLAFDELDADYFDYGNVQVALQLSSNPNTYDIVPATISKVHYSVNYTIGSVMIFAEDRNNNPQKPEEMIIKVTLTDADGG